MSWEEVSRVRHRCPCGKGEYEEVERENDWFQHETLREMLCPECRERYTYSAQIVGGHRGNEIERGWVLKHVLEAERNYQEQVISKVREVCLDTWRARFEQAKTKEQVWAILTANGKYYPSKSTFSRHTKGYDRARLMTYADDTLKYFHHLGQILTICGIRPEWETLGIVTGGMCELCGSQMAKGADTWICPQCLYRRPVLLDT